MMRKHRLARGLGGYPGRKAEDGLTLHDLGEFIRRVGVDEGYAVQSEFRVDPKTSKTAIDWVWLESNGKVVAAFEVEGRDADKCGVERDKLKLSRRRLRGAVRVIALFQVNHNHEMKRKGTRLERFEAWLGERSRIKVINDTGLICGRMNEIVALAKTGKR